MDKSEIAAPEGWTLAAGSAGFNVGDTTVYGRYAHGRALYAFRNRNGWFTGVVSGLLSTGGDTMGAACDSALEWARREPGRCKRSEFDRRMADPTRLPL